MGGIVTIIFSALPPLFRRYMEKRSPTGTVHTFVWMHQRHDSVALRHTVSKGAGLYATQAFRPGNLVAEWPQGEKGAGMMMTSEACKEPLVSELAERYGFDAGNGESLVPEVVGSPGDVEVKAAAVFALNEPTCRKGLVEQSMPNCKVVLFFDEDRLQIVRLYAIAPIEASTELTIFYGQQQDRWSTYDRAAAEWAEADRQGLRVISGMIPNPPTRQGPIAAERPSTPLLSAMDGGKDDTRVTPGEASDERGQDRIRRETSEFRATSNTCAGQAGQAEQAEQAHPGCDDEWLSDGWILEEFFSGGNLMRAVSSDDELAQASAALQPAVDKDEMSDISLDDGWGTLQHVGGTDSGVRFGPEHLAMLDNFASVFPDQLVEPEDASIQGESHQTPVVADHPAQVVQVVDPPTIVMTCKQCDNPAEKGNYGFCLQHRKKAS